MAVAFESDHKKMLSKYGDHLLLVKHVLNELLARLQLHVGAQHHQRAALHVAHHDGVVQGNLEKLQTVLFIRVCLLVSDSEFRAGSHALP